MTAKDLQAQLTRYFDGDVEKVKKLSAECKALDFKLSDNLESIQTNNNEFFSLVALSEFGFLGKTVAILNKLKEDLNGK